MGTTNGDSPQDMAGPKSAIMVLGDELMIDTL